MLQRRWHRLELYINVRACMCASRGGGGRVYLCVQRWRSHRKQRMDLIFGKALHRSPVDALQSVPHLRGMVKCELTKGPSSKPPLPA